jgi:hypothetical protein
MARANLANCKYELVLTDKSFSGDSALSLSAKSTQFADLALLRKKIF